VTITRATLLEFLRSRRYAVQSSSHPGGAPQSAVVGIAVSDDFESVFDTLGTSRKAANLRQRAAIAFVIGSLEGKDERTVQVEGRRTSRKAPSGPGSSTCISPSFPMAARGSSGRADLPARHAAVAAVLGLHPQSAADRGVGCDGAAAADVSFHEPLRVTLLRTGLLALAVGFGAALLQRQPASWPQWTAFALWFTFGGHWVEIFFLNWLGPRLAAARRVQVTARLLTWLGRGTLIDDRGALHRTFPERACAAPAAVVAGGPRVYRSRAPGACAVAAPRVNCVPPRGLPHQRPQRAVPTVSIACISFACAVRTPFILKGEA